MTERDNKKGNILVTYRLPEDTEITEDIDNEFTIQREIAKLMNKLVSDGLISHFVIADDDIISERLTNCSEELTK